MKHVIVNEVYFGYLTGAVEGKWLHVVVMRADVLRGAEPGLIDRVILAGRDEVRPATEADYERFKIAL